MNLPKCVCRFGYLLWKNILWKVRNWPGTILEIIFPTFLFILLIVLRTQNPPESRALQERAAKALPSAGLIPFMQTAYCDMNNKFNNRPDGLPDFSGSKVDSLYQQLAKIFNKTDGALDSINNFQDTFQHVSRLLGPDPPQQKDTQALNSTLSQLCADNRNSSLSLRRRLGLDSVCSRSLADRTSSLTPSQRSQLSALAALGVGTETGTETGTGGDLSSLVELYKEVQEDLAVAQDLRELFSDPGATLCGRRGSGGSKLLDYFADNSANDQAQVTRIKREADTNSTTQNSTEAGLEDTGIRIIFTPNNSLAWGIIREMNTSIHYIDVIRDLLNTILKQNREVQGLLDRLSEQGQDQKLVNGLRELASEQSVRQLSGLPSSDQLLTASRLLDQRASPNLWDYTAWVDGNVSAVLRSRAFRINLDIFRAYESEAELVRIATDRQERNRLGISAVIAGIVFQNLPSNGTALPPQVRYKIRSYGYSVVNPDKLRDLIWEPGPGTRKKQYLQYGFIFIQDLVERAVVNQQLNVSVNAPGGYVQPFPFPCYVSDDFMLVMLAVLPLLLVISSSLAVSLLARVLTFEREHKLQDMLSLMGVGVVEHWCSWIVVYMFLLLPSTCVNWAILSFGGVLSRSDSLLLLLVLLSYNLSLTAFAILASIPFKNANIAGSATGLIYFLLFFLTPVVEYLEFSLSVWQMLLVLLLSPSALGLFAYYAVQSEVQATGLHWGNLHMSPYNTDRANPLMCWLFLLLDAGLYFWLAFYLQAVLPGLHGVRRPWYFPLDPRYWLGTQRAAALWRRVRGDRHAPLEDESALLEGEGGSWEVLAEEEGPEHLEKGVEINRMGKTYSWGLFGRQKVAALHCLSLSLYEGQVTALLGHNGAGKTSLMMILSGILSQSSGSATIYGKSLERDIGQLRGQYLGLCPQHNILYDHLTADEHLLFYGSLRGLPGAQIRREAAALLACMRLLTHRGKRVQQLSGGMRRKLCVCIAFLGAPKLVVLDEPTAGIDPYSRRHIWDFLMSQREGRCTLLSTHHMDEAEVVGDRIAIIDHGHLLCVGGLPFLKQQFQLKYALKLEKESEDTATSDVTRLVQTHVPAAKLDKGSGEEVHFSIPLSAVREDESLSRLFSVLEREQRALGISSYGLETPTLEQLFLKLTQLRYNDEIAQQSPGETGEHAVASHAPPSRSARLLSPLRGCCLQAYALLLKRLHHSRRDLRGLVLQYFLFLFMLALTLWVTRLSPYPDNSGTITFSTAAYEQISDPNQFVILGSGLLPVPSGFPTAESYLQTIVCPGGLGVPSGYTPDPNLENSHFNISSNSRHTPLLCPWYPRQKWHSFNTVNRTQVQSLVNASCSCDAGDYQCPAGSSGPQPGTLVSVGDGSVLLDLRGRNASDYLLKTQRRYVQRLYGGVSFGLTREDVPKVRGDIRDVVNKNIRENNNKLSFETFVEREYSKAWFSFKGYHAMPVYLNVMNNAILRRELSNLRGLSSNLSRYGIVAASEPWPPSRGELALRQIRSGKPLMVPLMALFGFCFLASSYVLFVLEERVSGTKHLQAISGLNKLVYWSSSYCWDLAGYALAILLGSLVLVAFDKPEFVSPAYFPVFLAACMGFGCVSISLMYSVSWLFSSPGKAYVVMFCLSYVVGMITMIVNFSYDFINRDKNKDTVHLLENIFLVFPSYSLCKVLYQMISIYIKETAYRDFGATFNVSSEAAGSESQLYQFDAVWKYTTAMFVEAALLFLLNLAIDLCSDFLTSHPPLKLIPVKRDSLEGDDVIEEERRVLAGPGDYTLSLSHLYKRYFSPRDLVRPFLPRALKRPVPYAVRNLTLGVRGECFGLLGLNGAGKTSVFNMITGARSVSSGCIGISGQDIHRARLSAYRLLGYCAQFDSLFPLLTGREQLLLYGRLRGLSGRELARRVDQLIDRLCLGEYADMPSGRYSGGNKRKLSTAIALVSRPSLLLLDEPTAGIDPYAKQFLWKLIRELTSEGVSSLLTTHSMSECEALCSRIGIMKEGHLQCVGPPQHLKSRYGQGYVLKFHLAPAEEHQQLLREVQRRLPQARLKNEHQSLLDFRLEGEFSLSETLSHVFAIMKEFPIQEFSIGQTTLDDVFLRIVSEQEPSDSEDIVLTNLRTV